MQQPGSCIVEFSHDLVLLGLVDVLILVTGGCDLSLPVGNGIHEGCDGLGAGLGLLATKGDGVAELLQAVELLGVHALGHILTISVQPVLGIIELLEQGSTLSLGGEGSQGRLEGRASSIDVGLKGVLALSSLDGEGVSGNHAKLLLLGGLELFGSETTSTASESEVSASGLAALLLLLLLLCLLVLLLFCLLFGLVGLRVKLDYSTQQT